MSALANFAQSAAKGTATVGMSHAALNAEAAAGSAHVVSPDYIPLTPEGLLLFCQSQLQGMDEAIAKKMNGQTKLVEIQNDVTNIQAEIKRVNTADGFASNTIVENITTMIDDAIGKANAMGDPALAKNLEAVKTKLNAGTIHDKDGAIIKQDGTVSPEEAKELGVMLDATLTACRSGAELSMIELQSLVAKRGTALQLTTGMLNSINEGTKSIAGNIGR